MHVVMTEYFPVRPDDAPTGGVEQRMAQLVQRLHGPVLVLCSHQPGQPRRHRFGTAQVHRVGPTTRYSNEGNIVKRILFALALFWHGVRQPAGTTIDAASFLSYVPAALCRMFGARVIVTYHEVWLGRWMRIKGPLTGLFGEVWERMALAIGFNAVIAVSPSTQKELAAHGIRSRVITNGVNVPIGVARPARGVPTIVYLGRLVPGKRVDVLLQAAAHVGRKVRIIVIGDGGERRRLEAIARELGVDATFLGKVDSATTRRILERARVFCLPSAVEGFGISALEGMAAGIPTLLSDIPPLRDISDNGRTALLFPVDDHVALATALRRVLSSKGLAHRLAVAGKARACSYDWNTIARSYEDTIRRVAR